jgi:CRISPR-associated protein Csd1
MLGLLLKYAEDNGLQAEPGFKPKDVRWALLFDGDGAFLEVIELGDAGNKKNKGRTFPKCPDLSLSELIKGGMTRSHFLIETAQVIASYDRSAEANAYQTNDKKVADKGSFFLDLLRSAAATMPGLSKVTDSLSDDVSLTRVRSRFAQLKVANTDKVTVQIGDGFPVESADWHNWWRDFRNNLSGTHEPPPKAGKKRAKSREEDPVSGRASNSMRCFATGVTTEPVSTHPKIEALADVGGIPSGDVLIGYDKESFCSYGLVQSANAAVSVEAAAAYRAALNHLIKQTGQRLAGAKVVHWFEKSIAQEDDPLFFLVSGSEPEKLDAQERARQLLSAIRTGKRSDLLDNHYYALTLSGAAGRIMLREWMEGQFEELAECVAVWFDDVAIVRREGNRIALPPKFMAVLGATVRELADLPAPFVARMWRVAVKGEAIPLSALAKALLRHRVDVIEDRPFNHARMGLMKAFHLRMQRQSGGDRMNEELKPYLNDEHPHPAYQCGRLMAVLAALQTRALGDVGAGVVQRYYAAASATPAMVLGRVTRLSQFHLNKLDRGLAYWFDSKIAAIWARIRDAVPQTLTLEEQSLFALGYYQQLADLRSKKATGTNHQEEESNE